MDAAHADAIEIRLTPGVLLKGFFALTAAGFLTGCLVGTAARSAASSYDDALFARAFHAAQPASLGGPAMPGPAPRKGALP